MSVTDRLNIWSNWGCIHQISRVWEKHSSICPSIYGLERRDAIWDSWEPLCIWDAIVSILLQKPATSKILPNILVYKRLCTLIYAQLCYQHLPTIRYNIPTTLHCNRPPLSLMVSGEPRDLKGRDLLRFVKVAFWKVCQGKKANLGWWNMTIIWLG